MKGKKRYLVGLEKLAFASSQVYTLSIYSSAYSIMIIPDKVGG